MWRLIGWRRNTGFIQNFSVDYIIPKIPMHVGTLINQFTQYRQFRKISYNWCTKKHCYNQTELMMAQRCQLDMFVKWRIVGMLKSRQSQTEMSRILNVDQFVISSLWQRFQSTGDVTRRPVSGWPRITILCQDQYLAMSAQRQRGSTARELGSAVHSCHRNMNFETNCLQESQSYWPVCQKTSSLHFPHVCAEMRLFKLEFETSTLECGRVGQYDVQWQVLI